MFTYRDCHRDNHHSKSDGIFVDIIALVRQQFVDDWRSNHSEEHPQVYGKIEHAEEYTYLFGGYVLTTSDELIYAKCNDTAFYATHAN